MEHIHQVWSQEYNSKERVRPSHPIHLLPNIEVIFFCCRFSYMYVCSVYAYLFLGPTSHTWILHLTDPAATMLIATCKGPCGAPAQYRFETFHPLKANTTGREQNEKRANSELPKWPEHQLACVIHPSYHTSHSLHFFTYRIRFIISPTFLTLTISFKKHIVSCRLYI